MTESVYLCSFIFGGGDEIGTVKGPLKISDAHAVFVHRNVIEQFAALSDVSRSPI